MAAALGRLILIAIVVGVNMGLALRAPERAAAAAPQALQDVCVRKSSSLLAYPASAGQ